MKRGSELAIKGHEQQTLAVCEALIKMKRLRMVPDFECVLEIPFDIHEI